MRDVFFFFLIEVLHVCNLSVWNEIGSTFTKYLSLSNLPVAGVPESRRDLLAEAAAEGKSGWSDPASWRDGGPERPAKGAQCPAEGTGGGHAGPEGLLQQQECGAGEVWGRAEEDSVWGRFSVTPED